MLGYNRPLQAVGLKRREYETRSIKRTHTLFFSGVVVETPLVLRIGSIYKTTTTTTTTMMIVRLYRPRVNQ